MSRQNYDSVVNRVRDIISDKEGRYTKVQKKIAYRILDTRIIELAEVKDVDAYYRKIAYEMLCEDQESLNPLLVSPSTSIADVIVKEKYALQLGAEYGLKVEEVYRALVTALDGKVFMALKEMDSLVDELPYIQMRAAVAKLTKPILLIEIARNDLMLPEALVLANVFGLEFQELGKEIDSIKAKIDILEVAQAIQKNEEAKKEMESVEEFTMRHFQNLKRFWVVSLLPYAPYLSTMADFQQRENEQSFKYKTNNIYRKVIARQIEDKVVLIQEASIQGTEVRFFLLEASEQKPVVIWKVSLGELSEFVNTTVSIEDRGSDKVVHIKLEGLKDDVKSATVICDAASGTIKSVEAKGEQRKTVLDQVAQSLRDEYEDDKPVTWETLENLLEAVQKEATIAEELVLKNIYEKVYGFTIEVMQTRKQNLRNLYGREVVAALDPVIFVDEEIVESLTPGGSLFGTFCRRSHSFPIFCSNYLHSFST